MSVYKKLEHESHREHSKKMDRFRAEAAERATIDHHIMFQDVPNEIMQDYPRFELGGLVIVAEVTMEILARKGPMLLEDLIEEVSNESTYVEDIVRYVIKWMCQEGNLV